jgi:hypothetical protein
VRAFVIKAVYTHTHIAQCSDTPNSKRCIRCLLSIIDTVSSKSQLQRRGRVLGGSTSAPPDPNRIQRYWLLRSLGHGRWCLEHMDRRSCVDRTHHLACAGSGVRWCTASCWVVQTVNTTQPLRHTNGTAGYESVYTIVKLHRRTCCLCNKRAPATSAHTS